jgi:hypothetical protein
MNKVINKMIAIAGLLALLGSAACENIALIKRPTPDIDGDEIVGEVTGLDLRLNQLSLRSTESGPSGPRTRTVYLEENTQVLYRGREYPLNSLEVGDIVALQLRNRDRGSSTNLLRVERSNKDRQARQSGAEAQRIEGTVERVDSTGRTFELRERSGNNVLVSLAPNAQPAVADEVNRLRRGDYVLAQGRFLSLDRFELEELL